MTHHAWLLSLALAGAATQAPDGGLADLRPAGPPPPTAVSAKSTPPERVPGELRSNIRPAPPDAVSEAGQSASTVRSVPRAGYRPGAPVASAPDLEIRLQQAVFDPLWHIPEWPPALRVATAADGMDYHLVQFHGPIRPEWQAGLAARGAEIMDYVPDFAYIVRMQAGARTALRDWAAVRWVGDFPPALRLANPLLASLADARPEATLELMVRGFEGEPAAPLQASLRAAGATILRHGSESGGGVLFHLTIAETGVADLAGVRGVAWIEPMMQPGYANEIARGTTILKKNTVEQQLGLFGQGQIIAITDSGLSTGNINTLHQDFAGRVVGAGWGQGGTCADWGDHNSHGTHVAGSALGSGVRSGANPGGHNYVGSNAGIAPAAGLVVWSNCEDFSGIPFHDPYNLFWAALHDFSDNLRVNNNSWGSSNPSARGTYDSFARETDRFVRDFPEMIAVFATGNAGTDANADGVSDFTTIMPPSTAKNVIAVGGSENLRLSGGMNPGGGCSNYGNCWPQDYPAEPIASDRVSDNINGMYAASGRGPTLSNRLKPDIIAPATNVVSARNESVGMGDGVYNNYYIYMGGTSMASPLVSGGAAIVREHFDTAYGHRPSAALVKAVLINGARDITPGQYGTSAFQDVWRRPDINQGWGRMDLANTLIFQGARQPIYYEVAPGLQTGQTLEDPFTVGAGGQLLRVTLVWSDAPGLEATHGALVNDLDLEVVAPGGTVHMGWAGLVGEQRDRFNNFEEVELPSAAAGTYTLRVTGFNVPQGPQSFALVITGALAITDGDAVFRDRFE